MEAQKKVLDKIIPVNNSPCLVTSTAKGETSQRCENSLEKWGGKRSA